eukprot:3789438-Rhodomonas_salina.1
MMHAQRPSCQCWMACAKLCWSEADVVEVLEPGVLGGGAEDAHDEAMAAHLVLWVLGCEELKGALVLVLFDGCNVLRRRSAISMV